jgi:hypothetical protein
MALICYAGQIESPPNEIPENKIVQGDYIYCDASNTGALSFWGIYCGQIGVVALDGGGNAYLPKNKDLYLYNTYSYWTIIKRISCNKASLIIEEMN